MGSKTSPTINSMPFELRDSFKSKITDSNNKMRQSSVHTYVNDHRILPHEKRSLSQVGKNLRTSSVEEVTDDGKMM